MVRCEKGLTSQIPPAKKKLFTGDCCELLPFPLRSLQGGERWVRCAPRIPAPGRDECQPVPFSGTLDSCCWPPPHSADSVPVKAQFRQRYRDVTRLLLGEGAHFPTTSATFQKRGAFCLSP